MNTISRWSFKGTDPKMWRKSPPGRLCFSLLDSLTVLPFLVANSFELDFLFVEVVSH